MIPNACGIYKITNTVTGDYYIGSSNNVRKRISEHSGRLANNKHGNPHLQNAYNKYGEQAFEFSAILLCDFAQKLYFEQGFLDLLKPIYNIAKCAEAPARGLQFSEEHKRKISEANTGRVKSEATRHKLSESNKGKRHSEETRIKMSEAHKGELNPCFGKHQSEEHKSKLSKIRKGSRRSEETKQKMSEAHRGQYPTEETRRKRSEALKGRPLSEEHKRKMSEANKGELSPWFGKHHSDESKRKMSEARCRYIEAHKENTNNK